MQGGTQAVPAGFVWHSAAGTRPSRKKKVNEDSHLELPDRGIFAVSDGMGGHSAGDFASRRIVESLAGLHPGGQVEETVERAARRLATVNDDLMEEAVQRGAGVIIGATVVALVFQGWEAGFLWAGDSRLYLLRGGELFRLTKDHTVLREFQERGEVPMSAGEEHPGAHVLTRAVGSDFVLRLDRAGVTVAPGDRFLLCTDGLTKAVDEAVIAESLAEPPAVAVGDLLDRAAAARASDDVTVVAVLVGAEEEG